jgi:hypothetical protein
MERIMTSRNPIHGRINEPESAQRGLHPSEENMVRPAESEESLYKAAPHDAGNIIEIAYESRAIRRLAPLVEPTGFSDRARELTNLIIAIMSCGRAAPNSNSNLPGSLLVTLSHATLLPLCWHLAALNDDAARDALIDELIEEAPALVERTGAAAMMRGQDVPVGKTIRKLSSRYDTSNEPRQLPPVIIPAFYPAAELSLGLLLLNRLDPEAQPGAMYTISDKEIEDRIRACHAALCWFLGAADKGISGLDIAALLEEMPNWVRTMTNVFTPAGEEGTRRAICTLWADPNPGDANEQRT